MASKTLLTIEEYERLRPPDGVRYELNEGELIEMTLPTPKHNLVVAQIQFLLHEFAYPRKLGRVFPSSTGYVLGPGTLRGPDVSFVRAERLAGIDLSRNIPGAPDLAVEVVSPNDTYRELRDKVRQYLSAGGHTAWVVDPEAREVHVYTGSARPIVLGENDTLECPDLLPGFSAPVSKLFE